MNPTLFTTLISVTASIVVAYITALITHYFSNKKDKYDIVHKKKDELYVNLAEKLINIKRDPYLIFNNDLWSQLDMLRAEIKLYASKTVMRSFECIYNDIRCKYDKYCELFKSQEYFEEVQAKIENNDLTEEERTQSEDEYIDKNGIDLNAYNDQTQKLFTQMRKELGTNHKYI